MTTRDLQKQFGEDRSSGSRDMLADRQTHTDRQTDRLTSIPPQAPILNSLHLSPSFQKI